MLTMKKILAATAAAALVVTLAACSQNSASSGESVKAAAATPSATPTPTPSEDQFKVFPFGYLGHYDDGVEVSVSAAAPFTPDQYASGATEAHNVKFNVHVSNKGTKPIQNPVYSAALTSGGANASQVFDNSLTSPPATPLLPRQSVDFPIGFSVKDPADLTMTFTIDWDTHAAATFSTDAK
jgi:hypothetical protein